MCGIVGVLQWRGPSPSAELVSRMRDTMIHRGPDGAGLHVDAWVGLGHRRLAIIDLSPAGQQPMANETGTLQLVYNGEIYNFRELRSELEARGHRFASRTDAEVVIHAYEEWGRNCLDRFNGMFAFAIWDAAARRLFIARDRYGVKPLYYYVDDHVLLFASEVKALLAHPAMSVEVDSQALLEYFTFQNVFTDRTLFRGIKLLPPGHWACADVGAPGRLSTQEYWDFDFQEPARRRAPQEYEEELSELLSQAVCRQLVSDVPIGSYLSGGMDSGAITAMAAREMPKLTTFTGGFDLSSASGLELAFDERERAEALSYRFKTEHYEVVMKAGDMERVMPELIWHLEDLRVGQCYPNYYVARLAGKFVKVVLTGTGSDELFGGYPWRYYRAAVNQSFDDYVEKYYLYWQRLIPNKVVCELFQPHVRDEIGDLRTIDVFRQVMGRSRHDSPTPEAYVNRSLYFEIKTFLPGLFVVEDKLSMAHSLETRVPFMDNDLVEFATHLPIATKLRDLEHVVRIDENEPAASLRKYLGRTTDGKQILRHVLGRYMPPGYTEGVKQGFSGPDASWFRGESLDYVQRLVLDESARIYEYLRPETVMPLVHEHLSGSQNRRLFIWSLLSFEWWLRSFLGRSEA